jgi:DNA-directed RNA polymerase specialized sigma24 family protein
LFNIRVENICVDSMIERLTEAQFEEAIKGLNVGQQTIDIARGVLVEGRPQSEFVAALGLSKGAVSQAVSRVRAVAQQEKIPEGFERVSAVLPEHQAFIVKKWAEDATKKLETKK